MLPILDTTEDGQDRQRQDPHRWMVLYGARLVGGTKKTLQPRVTKRRGASERESDSEYAMLVEMARLVDVERVNGTTKERSWDITPMKEMRKLGEEWIRKERAGTIDEEGLICRSIQGGAQKTKTYWMRCKDLPRSTSAR